MRDNSLEPERALHDNWAMSTPPESVPVDAIFEAATAPGNRYIVDWLGNVEDLSVLDLGSGCGEAAVYFAKHGARVTAADLSPGMLGLVDKVASLHGVRVATVETSADRLSLPDNQFDIVYAANLLHHVDRPRCLDEIRRVLKPGGRAAMWDPLEHNPIIKVYRWLAKEVRTPEERPLAITDLRLFRSRFSQVMYKTFWLTTLWIFLRFFLIEHVSPSKERYWKKVILEADRLSPIYNRLERMDHRLLEAIPFLQRYCWNVVVLCVK